MGPWTFLGEDTNYENASKHQDSKSLLSNSSPRFEPSEFLLLCLWPELAWLDEAVGTEFFLPLNRLEFWLEARLEFLLEAGVEVLEFGGEKKTSSPS